MDAAAYGLRWVAGQGIAVRHIAAADQWEAARSFVETNHLLPGVRCQGKVEDRPLPGERVTLYVACPPRQAFSDTGGRLALGDPRAA
eukprot:841985-Alexandrium_andersonii.AAC.1